jgi:hypothetical protein
MGSGEVNDARPALIFSTAKARKVQAFLAILSFSMSRDEKFCFAIPQAIDRLR